VALPAVIDVLETILKTGVVVTGDGQERELDSHVSAEECRFLQRIVAETGARSAVEIGLAYGISAMAICEVLNGNGGKHIVIDPAQHERWQGIGMTNLKRCGFADLVELMEMPSHQALPILEARGHQVDFAFIDGMHTFDHTLVDFFYIDRLLKVGGVVALDDADFAAVRKVCRFIASNRSYRVLRCLGEADRGREIKHRLAESIASVIPDRDRLLAPEVVEPDHALGIVAGSRCVAFVKTADDERAWNFHWRF